MSFLCSKLLQLSLNMYLFGSLFTGIITQESLRGQSASTEHGCISPGSYPTDLSHFESETSSQNGC